MVRSTGSDEKRSQMAVGVLGPEGLVRDGTDPDRLACEAHLRMALDALQGALWDWNLVHGTATVSPDYFLQLGFEPGAFQPAAGIERDLVHPDDLARLEAAVEAVRKGPGNGFREEVRFCTRSGAWASIQVAGEVVARDEAGQATRIVGLHTDITTRLRAAEALRVSRETLSRIFQLSPSAIILTRLRDGVLLDVNESFTRNTGWTRDEALGQTAMALGLYPDSTSRALLMRDLQARGEVHNREIRFRRRGDGFLDGLISGRLLDLEGEPCLLAVIQDITELKRVQGQHFELLEQVRQLQKLECVGRLAGGVAHDFNNLLSPMLSYAELLERDLDAGDPRREHASQIQKAARRARELTRQLLAFSRKQVLDLRLLDLREVVGGFESLLRRTLRENILLQLDFPDSLPSVRGDAGQIEQVLMNLAVNAQDAMPEGGMLSMGMGVLRLEEEGERDHAALAPGVYVQLAVGDTGCGMDAEVMARIFEPFFTTKGAAGGTGLGLATVFGIVTQHGGCIRVESEPGAGTTFRIYLPAVAARADVHPGERSGVEERLEAALVVLVEDDAAVRESTTYLLETMGLRVLAFEDALSCLAGLPESEHVDLLLTDVVLPKLSGVELYRLLTVLRPGLKGLLMSGYSREALSQFGGTDPDLDCLQKPFTGQELLARIQGALGVRTS